MTSAITTAQDSGSVVKSGGGLSTSAARQGAAVARRASSVSSSRMGRSFRQGAAPWPQPVGAQCRAP